MRKKKMIINKDMKNQKVYTFGSCPLELACKFVDGEKYVSSNGDVLKWVDGVQNFLTVVESPLELAYENNTVENLTEVQLKLFWTLCK
jgi:hypothetical protein